MMLPVIKQTILTFFRDSLSWRAFKLLHWFKSYGDFAELVNFAYWWSVSGLFLYIYPSRWPKLTGATLQTRWSLICRFGLFVTLFLPLLYGTAKLKRFEMVLTVITRICSIGLGHFISQSIWKCHYWWSSLGRVCACRLHNRLVLTRKWFSAIEQLCP